MKKPEMPAAPAAPAVVQQAVSNAGVGVENSVMQGVASGPPALGAPGSAALLGGPTTGPMDDMTAVLVEYQKQVQREGREDRKLNRQKIDAAVRAARRAADPAAMISALSTMAPLGEAIASSDAGKATWRAAIGDAKRAWTQVQNAGDSQHQMMPASSKGGGRSMGFPDVCKAPAPPAPFVPIPYPNIGSVPSLGGKANTSDVDTKRFEAGADKAAGVVEDAGDAAHDAGDAAKDALQDGAEAAGEAVEDAAEEAQETGGEVVNDAQDTGEDVVNTVKGWF